MKTTFKNRLEARYQIKSDDTPTPTPTPVAKEQPVSPKPGDTDLSPGSSHPENWQTDLQSGKSAEEIRQEAISLANILQTWQAQSSQAQEYFMELTANSDKYLHLYLPILIKGLSRQKLDTIAQICKKFSGLANIV